MSITIKQLRELNEQELLCFINLKFETRYKTLQEYSEHLKFPSVDMSIDDIDLYTLKLLELITFDYLSINKMIEFLCKVKYNKKLLIDFNSTNDSEDNLCHISNKLWECIKDVVQTTQSQLEKIDEFFNNRED
jgi:hypothetical protein